MSLQNAFALWDWPSAIGLFGVGMLIGAILLPFAWPERTANRERYPVWTAGFLALMIGAVFFGFLIVARLFTIPVDMAIRTIGTSVEWVVFTAGMTVGLWVLSPPVDGASEAVIEQQAQAASQIPDASTDVGATVDDGSDNGYPVPAELDKCSARQGPMGDADQSGRQS